MPNCGPEFADAEQRIANELELQVIIMTRQVSDHSTFPYYRHIEILGSYFLVLKVVGMLVAPLRVEINGGRHKSSPAAPGIC